MLTCEFCGWEGEDVKRFVDSDEGSTTTLCMACATAVSLFSESKTVGKMHPARLVPLLRSIVAQSVGAMLAMVLSEFAKTTGKDEFNTLVDMLRNKGSTDPN